MDKSFSALTVCAIEHPCPLYFLIIQSVFCSIKRPSAMATFTSKVEYHWLNPVHSIAPKWCVFIRSGLTLDARLNNDQKTTQKLCHCPHTVHLESSLFCPSTTRVVCPLSNVNSDEIWIRFAFSLPAFHLAESHGVIARHELRRSAQLRTIRCQFIRSS